MRKYYANNLEKIILERARKRAKKYGWDFDLDESDIRIPEYCPILGLKLEVSTGKQGGAHNSPSLDRIDPRRGYTKDNVMVISWRANSLKNDATFEEIKALYNFYRGMYGLDW